MIQSVLEQITILPSNASTITFDDDDVRGRRANCCGWLQHNEGSPLYKILEGGLYEVSFNTNVSSATAGSVALGLYQDGILVPGTTAITEITTVGIPENISFSKVIKVCGRANATLTIASVPSILNLSTNVGIDTETPIIQNANLIIKRLS